MQRARAGAIARELVAQSPRGSIACIFAGGSFGRGEVWAAEIAGQLEVYSDLDIYVVARDTGSVAAVSAAAPGVSSRAPAIDGVRFLRAPDIGVYALPDLRAQPLRPGTIALAVHHVHLYGDDSIPQSLPAHDAERIPAEEALYLLENRLAELAAPPDERDASGARMESIRALKAMLDVHAAHAIVAGSFVPTFQARAQCFATDPPATLDDVARDDIAAAYRAAGDLAALLGASDPRREREVARRSLARAWRRLAPLVPETAGAVGVAAMLGRRERLGMRPANAREVVRLRRRTGMPAWRALAAAAFLSRRSPVRALRLDALARELHAEGELDGAAFTAHQRYLDRLTRTFGFGGELEKRVRSMHAVIS